LRRALRMKPPPQMYGKFKARRGSTRVGISALRARAGFRRFRHWIQMDEVATVSLFSGRPISPWRHRVNAPGPIPFGFEYDD
jgi:hypothetical protein